MTDIRSMHIEVEISIKASAARIFTALTNGAAVWWGPPYLERDEVSDLIFETKLGGRLYEKWGKGFEDEHKHNGAILGIVVAIKRPEYIRLQGPFGVADRCIQGVVSFSLNPDHETTTLRLIHDAIGTFDAEVERQYAQGWHALLERLSVYVTEGKEAGLRHHLHDHNQS